MFGILGIASCRGLQLSPTSGTSYFSVEFVLFVYQDSFEVYSKTQAMPFVWILWDPVR